MHSQISTQKSFVHWCCCWKRQSHTTGPFNEHSNGNQLSCNAFEKRMAKSQITSRQEHHGQSAPYLLSGYHLNKRNKKINENEKA